MNLVLEKIREATKDSHYRGRLYLVGGLVRDKLLGRPPEEDIDIVLEGDAAELAAFLFERGVSESPPVTYPRFGTAMLTVDGYKIELVGARKESYNKNSRKPSTKPGSLLDDILRRDFTINTLLENLHTGEVIDLTGLAREDLRAGIIRTPLDPRGTFDDDPLRMMRAVRFATRFDFEIEPHTYAALREMASRLGIVSAERIREEFIKILMDWHVVRGLEMLRDTGLLDQFAPEIVAMSGVQQNIHHAYDVWTHTMRTVELVPPELGIVMRLAALLHDVGKPVARTIGPDGRAHFYRHEAIGAEIARKLMRRLRFSNSETDQVAFLISMHLRVGEYDHRWSDAAVRRLLREAGDHLEDLIRLTEADRAATGPAAVSVDLDAFRSHVERVKADLQGKRIRSPLTGREIINLLGIEPGPLVGKIKRFLEEEVIEGRLPLNDKQAAKELVRRKYGTD